MSPATTCSAAATATTPSAAGPGRTCCSAARGADIVDGRHGRGRSEIFGGLGNDIVLAGSGARQGAGQRRRRLDQRRGGRRCPDRRQRASPGSSTIIAQRRADRRSRHRTRWTARTGTTSSWRPRRRSRTSAGRGSTGCRSRPASAGVTADLAAGAETRSAEGTGEAGVTAAIDAQPRAREGPHRRSPTRTRRSRPCRARAPTTC